jgi:hypothetical protein
VHRPAPTQQIQVIDYPLLTCKSDTIGTSIASPRPTGLTGRAIGGIVGGILGAVLLVALAVIIYLLKSRKMPPDTAEIEPEEREELTGAPGVEGARPNLEKTPGGRLRYQTQDVATGGRLDNAV